MHNFFDDMLQNKVIACAFLIVLVREKEGLTRFCVDYRKFNEVTRNDANPLPCIDYTVDKLAGSCWLSAIYRSGEWIISYCHTSLNIIFIVLHNINMDIILIQI